MPGMVDLVRKTVTFSDIVVKSEGVNAGEESRVIEACASEESIDRHGEVALISAIEAAIPGYMKNPVILAGHKHTTATGDSPVVGKCLKAWVSGKKFYIKVEFADTELGLEYYKLYKGKFQRAFSIGYHVDDYDTELVNGERVPVHKKIELLEISCVAVGANRGALSKSAKRKQDFIAGKKKSRKLFSAGESKSIHDGDFDDEAYEKKWLKEHDEYEEQVRELLKESGLDKDGQEDCFWALGDFYGAYEDFVKNEDFRKMMIADCRPIEVKASESLRRKRAARRQDAEMQQKLSEAARARQELKKDFNAIFDGVFSFEKFLKYLGSSETRRYEFSEIERKIFSIAREKGLDAAKEEYLATLSPGSSGEGGRLADKFLPRYRQR